MSSRAEELRRLFGDYRFEWRKSPEGLGDLFVEPPYFGQLLDQRPTLLVGGRGTGKTTALRSLLAENASPTVLRTSMGIYIRINKNRVRAFQSAGRSTEAWTPVFAHYFNLLAAIEFVRSCGRRHERGDGDILTPAAADAIGRHFGLPPGVNLESKLLEAIAELELYVNNSAALAAPILSVAEAPLRALGEIAQANRLILYCCIDEYENLLDYQQGVLNTYIKHCEAPLSYKVGLRRFGLRNRETGAPGDQLVEPDDYSLIDLASEPFEEFAESVALKRLQEASRRDLLPPSFEEVWPSLTRREEAIELGAGKVAQDVLASLAESPDLMPWAERQPSGDLYFIQYWALASGATLQDTVREAMADTVGWENRLNNYGNASIFWLSRGRKGARIHKYYCGIRTFLQIAGSNIRYFLELLDVSLQMQLQQPATRIGQTAVSPEIQTEAAREVGKRRLEQLEGLSEFGMDLKRLVLALGKVFFELARTPEGRAPEVTQFVVTGPPEALTAIGKLLEEGVSHQALQRSPRTKATSEAEMKDDEYRLHPIYCAYFEFSHRRKRRLTIDARDLLLVRSKPSQAISAMLKGRATSTPDEWPAQLSLFSSFYESTSATE